MDIYGRLVIYGSGEYLGLGGRDGGISLNHGSEYTAQGFNAQRQRSDIKKQYVFHFAFKNAGLDGSTYSYRFIRVNALGRFFMEFVADKGLYGGDTGRAADQKNLINVVNGEVGILHGSFHRFYGSLYQIFRNLVEYGTGQGCIEVNRLSVGINGNEGQVNVGGHDGGQFDLCFFSSFLQSLVGHGIPFQFKAVLVLEGVCNPVHHAGIEVIAAQMAVAAGSFYFKYAVCQVQDRYIECAAAQIVNQETVLLAVFNLVKAVSQGRGGRFVDDTENFKACNGAGILGGLALAVGKVSRAGNNSFRYFFAQISFCIHLQFLQNHGGDFLGSIGFSVNGYLVVAAHMTFNGNDGAVRVGYGLALCQLAYQPFSILGEAYHGRGKTGAFGVRNNDRFAAFHDSYYGVCCT